VQVLIDRDPVPETVAVTVRGAAAAVAAVREALEEKVRVFRRYEDAERAAESERASVTTRRGSSYDI
jgi:hypothetical protein